MILLAIAVGGALGALARYQITAWFPATVTGFPWATLLINVSGSLLLAFAWRYLDASSAAPQLKALYGVGFCGAFTTFSAFSFEAVRLMQEGQATRAGLYIGASIVFCMIGTVAGFALAARLIER